MDFTIVYSLIAYVTKVFLALDTVKQIASGCLLVHSFAAFSRTYSTKLSVNKGTLLKAHIL